MRTKFAATSSCCARFSKEPVDSTIFRLPMPQSGKSKGKEEYGSAKSDSSFSEFFRGNRKASSLYRIYSPLMISSIASARPTRVTIISAK